MTLLETPQRVHLIGIGGAGMSGIARILLQRGHAVSGSDLQEGRSVTELRVLGARVELGHDAANLGDARIVVISTAVPADNPELRAATDRGLRVLRRAEMLAALMADERAVLIAGTHGKTTTTSMTVVAMQAAGQDPSFAIGGSLNESGTNAHGGSDGVFVAEADESDRSFLFYRPDLAVVTNLEHDHPDEFVDEADVVEVFRDFLGRRTDGAPALLCADDRGSFALVDQVDGPVLTYGTSPRADLRLSLGDDGHHELRRDGTTLCGFQLAVPGRHNALNAAAALAVCDSLGLDLGRPRRDCRASPVPPDASSGSASSVTSRSSTTMRITRPNCAPPWPQPAAPAPTGSSWSSSPTATRAPRCSGPNSAARPRRPTSSWSPMCTRPAKPRSRV